jgi:phytanoyl-CoA hydroxylase
MRLPGSNKKKLSLQELEHWHQKGYLVLRNCFSKAQMSTARKFLEQLWVDRPSLTVDAYLGTKHPDSGRQIFSKVDKNAKNYVYKLNDAYLEFSYVRDLALNDRITSTLNQLIGEKPCICNSLIFERGSQQDLHVDTYYMPPSPGGKLIVTSICLEDVHPDAGPVQYIPGSHLLPQYRNPEGGRHVRSTDDQLEADAMMAEKLSNFGRQSETFLGKAGDVLIWHEELAHGGTPIHDMSLTRKSLVTHYWSQSSVAEELRANHKGGSYLNRDQQKAN